MKKQSLCYVRYACICCGLCACCLPSKAQLASGDGWVNFGGGEAVSVIPSTGWQDESDDLVDRGMTPDMVAALIGQPTASYWDNDEKTCYHAIYKYEVYQCEVSFSLDGNGRESNSSKILAKYAAQAKVYYAKVDGRWTVYKVIGSPKNYNAYRQNNFNPIRRMSVPDNAVLVERYR